MASVVYLTNRAPAKMIGNLMLAGHKAWECLSVSEVLYICERESIDVIIIDPEVDDADVVEAQMRRITLRLQPNVTAQQLIWELSNLFPDRSRTVH